MAGAWLQSLASIYVPLSIASALLIVGDIFLAGRRQDMPIMEAVWPDDAGGHGHGLRHHLSGELVADSPRHQGKDVGSDACVAQGAVV